MKTTRIYALFVLLLTAVFPSCAIIEINGLGNDYKDLTESQKALVRPLEIEYGRLTKVMEEL